MQKQNTSPFVTKIDLKLSKKMILDLKGQDFDISTPAYTLFSAKKKGLSVTLYESGKLMVQGKDMNSFIEFYLEPEILKSFEFTYQQEVSLDLIGRIGIDESGKGDFFGPLCVAGVFAEKDAILKLKNLGVKDSKALNDNKIITIADLIKKSVDYQIVKINPLKYNELIKQFKNLNRLLAWGHATAIENLVEKTGCKKIVIDQFADEEVVLTAIARKNLVLDITQRHRAEEDIVVAAASILARDAFLDGLKQMEKQYGMKFPKGASSLTIQAGVAFLKKFGFEEMGKVGKIHFKTLDAIRQNAGE